jgi:hypothetical protein
MNDPDGENGLPAGDLHETPDGRSASPDGKGIEDSGCLTRLEIAELACKIFALWVFAHAALTIAPLLVFLFVAPFQLDSGRPFASSALFAVMPAGEILVGVLLWTMSRAIGRRMVRDATAPVARTDIGAEHLMSIAFAVVGIYAVWASCEGLLQKAASAFYIARERGIESAWFWTDIEWKSRLLGTLGSLAFGLWLLFGSRGIVRIVRRIRGNGQVSREETAGDCGSRS